MSKKDKLLISPEDENMDAELARGLTKLNFDKSCADIYSQIVAEITHNAKLGFSVCVVSISADDNIMAWLSEKLADKGFEVEWEREDDFSVGIKCVVQWYEEGTRIMTTTNEQVDMTLYRDSMDYDAVKRGREYSQNDIEKYFCIRNFINAAYSNVVMGLNNTIHAKGIPDEVMFDFTFHHGHEDSEDNHSDTMEQLWSLEYKYRGKCDGQGMSFTFWFPCKLFWMRRAEIEKWFKAEDAQIVNFTQWMKRRGIINKRCHICNGNGYQETKEIK